MNKTSVEIDHDIARQAAALLGTKTLKETIDAALRDVIDTSKRVETLALLGDAGRFDLSTIDGAWGGTN